MANNPYVNKVQLADGTTLMDVTDTTAETGDVLLGEVFYTASGSRGVGTLDIDSIRSSIGIVVNRDIATINVVSGQYVIVQNSTITGITDGLYKATANVSSGTAFTSSDLDVVSAGLGGELKSLSDQVSGKIDTAGTGLSKSGTTLSISNSGVTAGSYGPSANATPAYGATFNVPYLTVDAQGRVTAASTKTVKIPASDNTNTWRGIQNNLTSDSTTDSLSAAQGKALNTKISNLSTVWRKDFTAIPSGQTATYVSKVVNVAQSGYIPISVGYKCNQAAINVSICEFTANTEVTVAANGLVSGSVVYISVIYLKSP